MAHFYVNFMAIYCSLEDLTGMVTMSYRDEQSKKYFVKFGFETINV